MEHLSQRWQDLFGEKFEALFYDLTRTYFSEARLSALEYYPKGVES
jgi:hypothetical protein